MTVYVLLLAILSAAAYLLPGLVPGMDTPRALWTIPALFLVTGVITAILSSATEKGTDARGVRNAMLYLVLNMVLCMALLLPYIAVVKTGLLPYMLIFGVFYIVFCTFQTIHLARSGKGTVANGTESKGHVAGMFLAALMLTMPCAASDALAQDQDAEPAASSPATALADSQTVPETAVQEEDVDVQEVIFDHIKDSYEWHIITIGEKHISIPLPVILHSKTTGWHFFMSDRLHETGSYEGFSICKEGGHAGRLVETLPDGTVQKPFDLSFTKTVAGIFINVALLIFLVLMAARWYKGRNPEDPAPRGFTGLVEYLVMMVVDDIIRPAIGKDYKRYAPYLLTVFFFIFLSNIMGLIPIFPGGANVTGNIAITLTLALMTFFAVNIFGNKEYWKEILWPDVPIFLKCPLPIMPLIELFGIFTKPFALTVRLFANIMAGHAVILALTCVIFITARMGSVIGTALPFISILFMIFMNLLELLVAYIQAYVFTMLSSVFIGLSRPEHRKE